MQRIQSTGYPILFGNEAYTELSKQIKNNDYSKIFVLCDENTRKFCLPDFLANMPEDFKPEIIEIAAGEAQKNINTCVDLWNYLTQHEADRKSLLINLGGGVITDMGGFVASTFKRGIRFINIPTTLLSMVDASVGSKTGVDLGNLKNQIGLFSNPEMVLIDHHFLRTVPEEELRSGLAEIIKYGFTFDKSLWETIKTFSGLDYHQTENLIHRSIAIKNDVVLKDLKEQNLRKTLNFGHTIGHAIESYYMENPDKTTLTHGKSVAIGMVIELFFSSKLFDFPMKATDELKAFVHRFFGKIDLKKEDFKPVLDLMIYDKKNVKGRVNFVLLKDFEDCRIDVQVPDELLTEGLEYYLREV